MSRTDMTPGTSGLDGTDLLPPPAAPARTDVPCLLAMRAALLAAPAGRAWLIATGALTNVALLLAAFPEVAPHLAGVSVMGGAVGGGFAPGVPGLRCNNARITGTANSSVAAEVAAAEAEGAAGNFTPWAEFNVYTDPEAAAAVFADPALRGKLVLAPLDATHQVRATEAVRALLLHGPAGAARDATGEPSRLRRMLHDLLSFFAHAYARRAGLTDGPPLHDPLAVAAVLQIVGAEDFGLGPRPDAAGGEGWVIDVVTEPGAGRGARDVRAEGRLGRTRASKAESGEPGAWILKDVNADAFWRCLEAAVGRAEACVARAEGGS